jgi:uncharacterized protein (DUF779 family)
MKKNSRKLVLAKETLRNLAKELSNVEGAQSGASVCDGAGPECYLTEPSCWNPCQ